MSSERLDDKTEALLARLCDVGIRHAVGEVEPAKAAVRSRIRFLIEEAVKAEKARIIRECEALPIGEMTHVDYDDD